MPDKGARSSAAGRFVAVVGPSGAGKDSLIAFARQRLAGDDRFRFVRRVITRPADDGAESHLPMDSRDFEKAESSGRFAVVWQAHGLSYGIPAETAEQLRAGKVAVVNCSRAALPAIGEAFPGFEILHVTATAEALARRLAARGRESLEEVEKRLARTVDDYPGREQALVIDNSGALEEAGEHFLAALRRFADGD